MRQYRLMLSLDHPVPFYTRHKSKWQAAGFVQLAFSNELVITLFLDLFTLSINNALAFSVREWLTRCVKMIVF
jgi:hypothetical protein